jgi:hypothetical protein
MEVAEHCSFGTQTAKRKRALKITNCLRSDNTTTTRKQLRFSTRLSIHDLHGTPAMFQNLSRSDAT